VLRRLFKWLPISIELAAAIDADERAELGLPQDNPLTVDVEAGEILEHNAEHAENDPPKEEHQAEQDVHEEGGQADTDDEWLAAYEAGEGKQ
jgi:recombinational DNA repair protein RecT